jgi:cytochrome d ubiquinol oxidase subunit II
MLAVIWFWIVAVMLAAYVVLDGFDLGAGALHLGLAHSEEERRQVLAAIGPVWDGNEVWLLAAGGALYCAFPALYATALSGFYLPLMIVLWLLILRGISIEFRGHIANRVWRPLWDAVFCLASAALAVGYGAALGNVVRGVPLEASGEFLLPLWTDFQPGVQPGLLDWYTLLAGCFTLAALSLHGALWLAVKTSGALQERARAAAWRLAPAVVLMLAAVTFASFAIQPRLGVGFAARPAAFMLPALAVAALIWLFVSLRAGRDGQAFLASSGFLASLLASVVGGLFPHVLPASGSSTGGLTVAGAAAPEAGLRVALTWFVPGFALAVNYFVFLYRKFAGKVASAA